MNISVICGHLPNEFTLEGDISYNHFSLKTLGKQIYDYTLEQLSYRRNYKHVILVSNSEHVYYATRFFKKKNPDVNLTFIFHEQDGNVIEVKINEAGYPDKQINGFFDQIDKNLFDLVLK